MKKRVYIETTIPSFYFEPRSDPEMVARRDWTRRWWADAGVRYELVTSVAVLEELSRAGRVRGSTRLLATHRAPAVGTHRCGRGGDRPGLRRAPRHAPRLCRRRAPPGFGVPVSVRFSRHLELQPPRERKQVRPHQTNQHATEALRAGPRYTTGADRRR